MIGLVPFLGNTFYYIPAFVADQSTISPSSRNSIRISCFGCRVIESRGANERHLAQQQHIMRCHVVSLRSVCQHKEWDALLCIRRDNLASCELKRTHTPITEPQSQHILPGCPNGWAELHFKYILAYISHKGAILTRIYAHTQPNHRL